MPGFARRSLSRLFAIVSRDPVACLRNVLKLYRRAAASEAEGVHEVIRRAAAAVHVHLGRVELVHAARDLQAASEMFMAAMPAAAPGAGPISSPNPSTPMLRKA